MATDSALCRDRLRSLLIHQTVCQVPESGCPRCVCLSPSQMKSSRVETGRFRALLKPGSLKATVRLRSEHSEAARRPSPHGGFYVFHG